MMQHKTRFWFGIAACFGGILVSAGAVGNLGQQIIGALLMLSGVVMASRYARS
jgi:drug/metabolite transporter (DMT)-like permease